VIKVLGLALYGPLAASTRYRLGQYAPGLARQGIDLDIRHLLGDEYLRRRFSGGAIPWFHLMQNGWKRLGELYSQKDFDLAILYCELFPLLPGWAEQSLLAKPYIYDFDDAFYLKYSTGKLGIMRPILGNKFDVVMEGAAAITPGNSVLDDYARRRNNNTHLLPTVVDTDRYMPVTRSQNDIFTVGWIGSPSTAPYLAELIGPLSQLGKESPVRLIVIGGKAPLVPNVTVEEFGWNESTEVALINTFDVGVMPLPDDDWARGKCAFKLIQYMACAVPVVASRVGANIDVVQADCGFLANSENEWVEALRFIRDQAESGRQMGEAGRTRVEQHYSLRRNLPILTDLIRKTVEQTR
jgi:glycosyltransferase involved in cell wall biosynthesis